MKPLTDTGREQAEIVEIENGAVPEAPQIETAEITSEQLEDYKVSVETKIDEQTADVLAEGQKR